MADIEFEIDGKTLTAKPGQTVIEVADAAGIYIPRFCYHKHLTVAANCRMCLVEVEKSPKALPACATPVMPGMKVFTKSAKTIDAQRAVMEFLLINHPLDCPICDQGGECELQDLAMGYGSSHSHYNECKRAVADDNLGPLIATEMTRCILCTRCVRYGQEVAGVRELGVTERGGHAEITTYVAHTVTSEVSGNIIDLCPVGALTSKPFRFTARAWELDQHPGVSPHDCMGSHLNIHTLYGIVKRVVSREKAEINQTWLSDRDRFAYTGVYHADRVEQPAIKENEKWSRADWQHALEKAADGLKKVIAEHGADNVGALASPNSTLEEFYLLQSLLRGLGSSNIDSRLREVDTRDQADVGTFPGWSLPFAELDQCDGIVLIGSNIQKELPLAAIRIRKAALKNATVIAINSVDYDFNFNVEHKFIAAPHALPAAIANNDIAKLLADKQKIAVIVGEQAVYHPQASVIRSLAQQLADQCGGKLNLITAGANSAGAWIAGAIPHRQAGGEAAHHQGLNAHEMIEKPRKAYILLNVEPDLDFANTAKTIEAMKQADFVISLSLYRNPILEQYADVILPIAAFTETSGTYVNANGEWQTFKGAAKGFHGSRPAWKVLRVLGNFLQLDGFEFESSEEVRKKVADLSGHMHAIKFSFKSIDQVSVSSKNSISRIGEIPIYAVDSLVRRATPLQEMQTAMYGDLAAVRINPETAKKLNWQVGAAVSVKQHQGEAKLEVIYDEQIAKDAVWIAAAIDATKQLGELFGEVIC